MNYPEHEKMGANAEKYKLLEDFLYWLSDTREPRTVLCYEDDDDESAVSAEFYRDHTPRFKLLAEYFQIDPKKLEEEKREMLKELRGET